MMKWFFRIVRKKKSNPHYLKWKTPARKLIHSRLDHFAPQCEVSYNRVAIRNSKTNWGSCSSLGNLNFNYRLLFLPACLRDYVIVHELCHRKVMNHSPAFWQEVEKVLPNYKSLKAELKRVEKTIGTSERALHNYRKTHSCEWCLECEGV